MHSFQFLNGAGNSPKDRVALSIIEMVSQENWFIEIIAYVCLTSYRLNKKGFLSHIRVILYMKAQ